MGLIFAKYDISNYFLDLGKVTYQSVSDPNLPTPKEPKTQNGGADKFRDVLVQYLPWLLGGFDFAFKKADPKNFMYFKSGVAMTSKDNQDPDAGPIELPLRFTANEFVKMTKWLSEI